MCQRQADIMISEYSKKELLLRRSYVASQQLFIDLYNALSAFRMLRKEVVVVFMQQLLYLLGQEQDSDDVRNDHE